MHDTLQNKVLRTEKFLPRIWWGQVLSVAPRRLQRDTITYSKQWRKGVRMRHRYMWGLRVCICRCMHTHWVGYTTGGWCNRPSTPQSPSNTYSSETENVTGTLSLRLPCGCRDSFSNHKQFNIHFSLHPTYITSPHILIQDKSLSSRMSLTLKMLRNGIVPWEKRWTNSVSSSLLT